MWSGCQMTRNGKPDCLLWCAPIKCLASYLPPWLTALRGIMLHRDMPRHPRVAARQPGGAAFTLSESRCFM